DNVNFMAGNLTGQVRNIAEVTTAVANGDLSKKITVDVKGEILELKNTVNTMVDQLNSFAAEVTRVAREVGTEGKLGGQAQVKGVGGTWKDLTDNVNFMAANLTGQVRNIANVVTAVANGDLKRKLAVEAKGEIAALADTINGMIETLATFADQVTNVAREVGIEGKLGGQAKVPGAAGLWRDLTDNVNQLAANLTTQVRAIAEVATAVTKGDLTRSITVEALGEVAVLKENLNEMIRNLKDTTLKNTEQDWLKTNLARFTRMLQGERDLGMVSKLILSELGPLVNAHHGVFYLSQKQENKVEPELEMLASYAYKKRKNLASRFKIGEGLVGQCAYEKERILITNVPDDYVQVNSGLGEAAPRNIIVLPVLFEGEVKAIIELASFNYFSETHQSFLDQLTESIGIVLNTIAANMRTEALLKQSQSLASELQSQQDELKQTNDRLEQQAQNLQKSEELLKNQQEELQQTNEELEEKAHMLSQQKAEVESKNREVEFAKSALEEKAEQLTLTSKYKSEFLANMSHELRTPLNSLLILSKLLSDNSENNLSPKQTEFARTIHASGADLLSLINDILDLSKIESGTVTLDVSRERFADILAFVEQAFNPLAQTKGLKFITNLDKKLPPTLLVDPKRLQQILKNLLSNAFKFTQSGKIEMRIETAEEGWSISNDRLNRVANVIAFSVIDTGIGISPEKQGIIFEAFQQADGTTSRMYGGTGLGLSISREIAALLGGEIRVTSTLGEGSTFTLYIPLNYQMPVADHAKPDISVETSGATMKKVALATVSEIDYSLLEQNDIKDDRDELQPGDCLLLIVENDLNFVPIMIELAHEKGFKAIVALRGHAALAVAKKYRPDAITLDIGLPDIDGWTVLDLLKHDPLTRHIPVHVISVEEQRQRGLQMGAIGYLEKPADKESLLKALSGMKNFVERPVKKLLVVEDDEIQRNHILELIGNGDVETTAVSTGKEALELLQQPDSFDCIVVDLKLPDMRGIELIERIRKSDFASSLPVIVYTAKDLTRKEETKLRKLAETIIIKDVKSPERLLDETALFLHRAMDKMPESKRQLLKKLHQTDPVLAGKRVLIVDDDIRNIFSLTSVLEQQLMEVVYAESGKDGIQMLEDITGIGVVLMDVMMPEMDGYDTIRMIRNLPKFAALPIIALTAKAMKGDRDKCIEAGASDYIAKPVDIDQLLSLLRVWLYR
ncbi:MAG: response regulator, partial [Gammaproteobacteria bacterium]